MVAQLDAAGAVAHETQLDIAPYSVVHSAMQLHVDRSSNTGTLFAIASSPHHYESVVAYPLAFDAASVKIVVRLFITGSCYKCYLILRIHCIR